MTLGAEIMAFVAESELSNTNDRQDTNTRQCDDLGCSISNPGHDEDQ
jgi:hypothetical protein